MEMNIELRNRLIRQWHADLLSGEFQQGQGCLKNDNKYCCLGVLCESAKKIGIPGAGIGERGQEPNCWFPTPPYLQELFETPDNSFNPKISEINGKPITASY